MKKYTLILCLSILLFSGVSCKENIGDNTINNQVEANIESKEEKEIQKETEKESDTGKIKLEEYSILENGDLQIIIGNQRSVLEINALPDSHILQDDNQRLLILTDPTDMYKHGILGDELEASSVTIVKVSDSPEVLSKFTIPKEYVIESIRPIWTDWDGDGEREILLTLSNGTLGATLTLFDENGNLIAESESIGMGYRWRHALEINNFGENGEKLLVDVITPHIGGIVSFYSWDKENKLLKTVASLSGYSTHDIGSREMNMYTTLKDDVSKQVILILPDQSKREIAGLRLEDGSVREEWSTPLSGKLSGSIEIEDDKGILIIRAIIEDDEEVILNIPE